MKLLSLLIIDIGGYMVAALQSLAQAAVYDYSNNAGGTIFGSTFFILYATLIVVAVVAFWRVFTKAGKPGWAAIIPFYSSWVMAEIAGRPGWFGLVAVLVAAIPVVGWIASIVMLLFMSIDIAVKFGKSTAFGVVGLWIFSLIGYLILGFGSATYDASRVTNTPRTPGIDSPGTPSTPARS